MKTFFTNIKISIFTFFVLLLICGLIYPLVLTGIGQLFFPYQANGSLVKLDGKVVGSAIVGQKFTSDYFLQSRPSANDYYQLDDKGNVNYSLSNLGPSSDELKNRYTKDIALFLDKNPSVDLASVPSDLFTASGSSLDPHIYLQSALVQLDRIALASKIDKGTLEDIVNKHVIRNSDNSEIVNVLLVNNEIASLMK
ncbi:MAG: potassium-transporting ATPase subunit C [Erysipelotrichaceae bacterium]